MRKITLLLYGMIAAALVLVGCATQPAGQPAGQSSPKIDTFESLAANVAAHTAAKPSVHFVLTTAVAGQSFTGDGDAKLGAQPALQLTMSVPPVGQLSARLIDDLLYLKLPENLALGKPWVRVDPNGDDPISRTLGASLRQLKQNGDPAQSLQRFQGAAVITAQRPEQLNDKATIHYSMTIDMKKVSAGLNDPDLKQMIDKALQAGVDTFPVELWVDQEYLPVRTIMDIPFKNPRTQQADRVKVSIDYSDWGKPVTISAPPDEQVGEFPR
jgi:hypothetical protein